MPAFPDFGDDPLCSLRTGNLTLIEDTYDGNVGGNLRLTFYCTLQKKFVMNLSGSG
jgi:hypothetical protein